VESANVAKDIRQVYLDAMLVELLFARSV